MSEAADANRARWDELASVHGHDDYYDVDGFLAGGSALNGRERDQVSAAVGHVAGIDLLHLQCHFGLGTLSWARLGAYVTGLDFSRVAVERARHLATTAGLDARFVQADAQQLPDELTARFDLVFASYGVLCWIADVDAWMRSASAALRPGGKLALIDSHPLTQMIEAVDPLVFDFPYQGGAPHRYRSSSGYASSATDLRTRETVQYPHGLGEIVTAAITAGFHIEAVTEFLDADGPEGRQDLMVHGDDDRWRLSIGGQAIPVQYALGSAGLILARGWRSRRRGCRCRGSGEGVFPTPATHD
ncbi:MAG: class I SAM-dependent methyltransferase [Frankia sp.]